MIDIDLLTYQDIGREVIYNKERENERGRITSFNHKYVFVRYREGFCGQATDPNDLEFIGAIK